MLNKNCNHRSSLRYSNTEKGTITLIPFLCSWWCNSVFPSDYQYQILYLVGCRVVFSFPGQLFQYPLNEDSGWNTSESEKLGSSSIFARNISTLMLEVFFLFSIPNWWDKEGLTSLIIQLTVEIVLQSSSIMSVWLRISLPSVSRIWFWFIN